MLLRIVLLQLSKFLLTVAAKISHFIVDEVEISVDVFDYATLEQRIRHLELVDNPEIPKEVE